MSSVCHVVVPNIYVFHLHLVVAMSTWNWILMPRIWHQYLKFGTSASNWHWYPVICKVLRIRYELLQLVTGTQNLGLVPSNLY